MSTIYKFEERDRLFSELKSALPLVLISEEYSEKSFGNFSIVFSSGNLIITYFQDRSTVDMLLTSIYTPNDLHLFALVMECFYDIPCLSADEETNLERIDKYNNLTIHYQNELNKLFSAEDVFATTQIYKVYIKERFERLYGVQK